jgi:ABC-2 type transport system ATP-binding protein
MAVSLAIETRGLTKSYGRVQALRGVDLEVRQGEMFGFLGPNGAGKTTTIRCLLDLIRPNGGSLRVLGLDPQKQPLAVRRRVGYLPGELRLDDTLTVEGQLRYLSHVRGDKADWARTRRMCDRLDLDPKPLTRNLSKGNKQKVGVVQALMHRSELLLMDEPTFGLDPLMQQEVLRMLDESRDEGATVFFSSHILSEVQEIAERVGIIRQGLVVEVAETASLIQRTLRRLRVWFKQPVDLAPLRNVPRVRLVSQEEASALLEVEGDIDELLKVLTAFPVRDLETERPSLEEIFLAYYAPAAKEER